MYDHSIHVLLFFIISLICLLSYSAATDTVSANQVIEDGKTVVSKGEMFELGFFSPGRSKNRYLGIWYKKISTGTVVWVANRETPINDTSSVFKLCRDGNLVILSGGNTVVWSSNSTTSVSLKSNDFVAQLLDTGNLVVWDKNKNIVWESFDYPGDTLLPGMKFGKDFVAKIERYMTSWMSPDDPSPGLYNNKVDTNGYPQILGYQGTTLLSRLGPWHGLGFSGFPIDIPNPIYSVEFVINEKEIYHKYELKSSVIRRIVLTWEGKTLILHWIERIQKWIVYADIEVDNCGRFALCGPYGSCSINKHPPCTQGRTYLCVRGVPCNGSKSPA